MKDQTLMEILDTHAELVGEELINEPQINKKDAGLQILLFHIANFSDIKNQPVIKDNNCEEEQLAA